MRYKLLGHSGLRVAELSLGTMTFGEEWGMGSPEADARAILNTYAEAGGNFLDTANFYTKGTSEKMLGKFIAGQREKWVVATKYTLNTGEGEVNAGGNHRKNMVQAVEASLKRLGTEYIDLLWLHAWDFTTPVEEVMRAFDDLVRAGKVFYIGVSDTPAWIISQANTLAQLRGWTPFVGLQIEYSLRERTPERDLIPMAKAFDITVTAWSPLAGGILSGKYNKGGAAANEPARFKPTEGAPAFPGPSERDLKIAGEVVAIGQEIGRPASQVALNWLRQRPSPVIPIIGSRRLTQLKENLGCLEWTLNAEQLGRLDAVSAIELGFPHDFLASPTVNEFAHGGALKKIDNHRR